MRKPTCVDCHRASTKSICERCKAERRRLHAIHLLFGRAACPADAAAKELRVELYAAAVARGGRLFDRPRQGGGNPATSPGPAGG